MIIVGAFVAATYISLDSGNPHLAAAFALLAVTSTIEGATEKIIEALKKKP